MEYAGRLHRFLAFLVDAIVISIIILVLGEVGVIDPLGNEAGASTQVVEAVIAFGYYILLTVAFGATAGLARQDRRDLRGAQVTPKNSLCSCAPAVWPTG